MPVREEKLIERDGLGGKKFALTQEQWNELDNRVFKTVERNKEVVTFVEELSEELSKTFNQIVKVGCRAFRSIHEHSDGSDKVSSRSYLSMEVVSVDDAGKTENYYLDTHPDLGELRETIIQDLYVRRARKQKEGGDGESSSDTVEGDGGEPRKSRLEKYTEKICESVDVIQSAKRRTRGNSI